MTHKLGSFTSIGLVALLYGLATQVGASSYPPGDNMPYLVEHGEGARVYFSCLDYQPDDGVMQCGRPTTSDDPGDCYYVETDRNGNLEPVRHKVDCEKMRRAYPRGSATSETIYKKYADELDTAAATAIADNVIFALRTEPGARQKLLRYTTDGRTDVPVNWDGWIINPDGASSKNDRLAIIGRFCKGRSMSDLGFGELNCNDSQQPNWGSFGLMQLGTTGKSGTVTQVFGKPAVAMDSDITSAPEFLGDQIFVGWAKKAEKEVVLALSSVDTISGRYCEWTLRQPDAIDPPIPIKLLQLNGKLLGASARDGLINIFSVDPREWNASCGTRGVKVGRVVPILELGQDAFTAPTHTPH